MFTEGCVIMTVNYDSILNQLNKKFTLVSKNKKNYFINEEGAIVASYDANSISMYFEFPADSQEILNHHGIVVATFAKNFQVNDKIADIIIVDGLCGACNDTKMIGNYAYMTCDNSELRDFYDTNSKQKQFDQLPYEDRIKILEEMTGASFKGASIDGIRLFSSNKEAKISSCGHICSSNGIAQIKLSDEMIINGIHVNKKDIGFDLNVININGQNHIFDSSEVYDFWRHENDWYYTVGRDNVVSPETIEWTERRKKSTVDKDAVFYIGNPYSHILDTIYYNSKSSLNSRRLQMKYILSQLVPEHNSNEMMKDYDFSKREVAVEQSHKK